MMHILMMVELTMMLMTKPYDYDDDTDYDHDHKFGNYTAAGAAPGASVPCCLFLFPRYSFFVLHSSFFLPCSSFFVVCCSCCVLCSPFFVTCSGACAASDPNPSPKTKPCPICSWNFDIQATMKFIASA